VTGLPSHPDADHPGSADAEPAFDGGSRRLRILAVAVALVVLVVVLHVTGVVGGGH